MYSAFLIKYAEIAIKGKNRYIFEDKLVSNIISHLKRVEGSFQTLVLASGESSHFGTVEFRQNQSN